MCWGISCNIDIIILFNYRYNKNWKENFIIYNFENIHILVIYILINELINLTSAKFKHVSILKLIVNVLMILFFNYAWSTARLTKTVNIKNYLPPRKYYIKYTEIYFFNGYICSSHKTLQPLTFIHTQYDTLSTIVYLTPIQPRGKIKIGNITRVSLNVKKNSHLQPQLTIYWQSE